MSRGRPPKRDESETMSRNRPLKRDGIIINF